MSEHHVSFPDAQDTAECPVAEIIQHVILFVETPPGPITARAVYDVYRSVWGDPFDYYAPTTFGNLRREWSEKARFRFENQELPDLRLHDDWGYMFWQDRPKDAWQFAFHGYKPVSEPGKASYYRFEFDRKVDPQKIKSFVSSLLQIVHCISGYAGYAFRGFDAGPHAKDSFDQRYRWAMRYKGVEMVETDVTAASMLNGYKSPNWLTVIGEPLRARAPEAVDSAMAVAHDARREPGGVVLQASEVPLMGDRNKQEAMPGYEAIARKLIPIQIKHHGSFGGSRWTEENTMDWLRRFTV